VEEGIDLVIPFVLRLYKEFQESERGIIFMKKEDGKRGNTTSLSTTSFIIRYMTFWKLIINKKQD
jgi:hypothetical protein